VENIFRNTQTTETKYYNSSVFVPYIGLRLVNETGYKKFANYVVTKIPNGKSLAKKVITAERVDMMGNIIPRESVSIKLENKIGYSKGHHWVIVKESVYGKVKYEYEDVVSPGIAHDDGFLIFSPKAFNYTTKADYDPEIKEFIPKVGLLALIHKDYADVYKYVVSSITPLTLEYIGYKSAPNTITASYIDSEWRVSSVDSEKQESFLELKIELGRTVLDERQTDTIEHRDRHM